MTHSTTHFSAAVSGWFAMLGLLALAIPVAQVVAIAIGDSIPMVTWFLVAIAIAYFFGGYVAGRFAGHHTGFHGLLMGILGVAVALVLTALSGNDDALSQWIANYLPAGVATRVYVAGYGAYAPAAIGLLLIVLCSWVGGMMAPSRALATERTADAATVPAAAERHTEIKRERATTYRTLPAMGAKGGERIKDDPEL